MRQAAEIKKAVSDQRSAVSLLSGAFLLIASLLSALPSALAQNSMGIAPGRVPEKLPNEARTPYRGYARNIGLAFQIADDLIDFSGDEAAAGKRTGKDAHAGKATFVSLLGEERARQQAGFLVNQAIEHLSGHGAEADLLRAIARFAVERDH